MNNLMKSKTRLTFIQIIFENLSTKNDIFEIFNTFNINYKSTHVDNFFDKKKIKFEFNSNFLKKLISYFNDYTKSNNYLDSINKFINFDRNFEKWDIINKSIFLAAISELNNIEGNKLKIVLNDYLNISKSFIEDREIGIINAVLDKMIYEKK